MSRENHPVELYTINKIDEYLYLNLNNLLQVKVKAKVLPITGHEGPEGE